MFSNKRVWLLPFGRKRNSISEEELAEIVQIIEKFELSSKWLFDGSTVISLTLGRTKFNGYNVYSNNQHNDVLPRHSDGANKHDIMLNLNYAGAGSGEWELRIKDLMVRV